jgi:pimeloyl-ACP methyl ester carboxylesterase
MATSLILLHGALGSSAQLDPLADALKHDFEIHAFNFSGHGGTEFSTDFSIHGFAKELEAFIQNKNLAPANIFGYSMGGYVALQLAKERPGLIQKIMTLGTKLRWSPEISAQEIKLLNPEVIEEKVPKFAEQLKLRHAPLDWKDVMKHTADLMIALGNGEAMTLNDFQNIHVPVLITLGALDQMVTQEESRAVVEVLPNGSFEIFDGIKHPIETIDVWMVSEKIKSFFA